jgi:hypothetical protein
MYPRQNNWSYNRLVKPHEAPKVVEIVNPEIVSIEADNTGKLIRPDGSNEKISFKKAPKKPLEGKGKKKKKKVAEGRTREGTGLSVNFKREESDEESSDYEEPEEPRKRPAQRLLETIKNEKKEEHINSSKQKVKKNPKKQMSDEDKKKIAELMKRLRS